MGRKSVDDASLAAVANKIREKTGNNDTMVFPDGFIEKIDIIRGAEDEFITKTLVEYSNDRVTYVADYAFESFPDLKSVVLPYVVNIGNSSFYGNYALQSVSMPALKIVGDYAFQMCESMNSVDFSSAIECGEGSFYSCTALISIDLPNVITIGAKSFYQCTNLKSVNCPNVETVGANAFQDCTSLSSVDFKNLGTMGASAYVGCSALETVIIRSATLCAGSSNMFRATKIASGGGYIYVPAALVDSYKTATRWSTYANQFRAIEDYPDICGN